MSLVDWALDSEIADEDLERAEGCYKLLLDADSDLTSVVLDTHSEGYFWANAYSRALLNGSFVSHSCSDVISTK